MIEDLFAEIGTEELPPKLVAPLGREFLELVLEGLERDDFSHGEGVWFATPRRLAVLIRDVPYESSPKPTRFRGPPLAAAKKGDGTWSPAAIGFATRFGLKPEDLEVVPTARGDYLEAVVLDPTIRVLGESFDLIVMGALSRLSAPKKMRWGSFGGPFVRPVQWSNLMHGNHSFDGGQIYTVKSENSKWYTRGHRYHCDRQIKVPNGASYEQLLETEGFVIPDFSKRREKIRREVESKAQQIGGIPLITPDLLDEVTGLVEWPVVYSGSFDISFLKVPAEALITTMQENQKYFPVVDKSGNLLPHFIFVSNIESNDPSQVIQGNEKVVRPRLSDAAFFFETDKQMPLSQRVEKLQTVVFQQQLGTVYDKALRVQSLAGKIAAAIDGNVEYAERAALLAKADLVSSMVLEFDTMQGLAGRYYALHDGEAAEVAEAIAEQYLPRFAGDTLPESKTACALALADRLDTLVGIFGIGQAPTGSKDPFALRRAALAVLRILVEKEMPLDLATLLARAKESYSSLPKADEVIQQVLDYCIERFRAWYEDAGIPVQVFQAVSARNVTVPLDFDARVKAVHAFSQLEQAQALAAANKRVANILAKQNVAGTLDFDASLLQEDAEKKLADAVAQKRKQVEPLFAKHAYTEGLAGLASLREPVDNFFDHVMVMVEDTKLRDNRLALLSELRNMFLEVADISLLATANA